MHTYIYQKTLLHTLLLLGFKIVERLQCILKPILKYKKHSSIVAIRNANNNSHFHFDDVSVEEVYKEVIKLIQRKSDIPIRVLKENAGIFADYICGFFNESRKNSTFPFILKNANITPVFKKGYKGSE